MLLSRITCSCGPVVMGVSLSLSSGFCTLSGQVHEAAAKSATHLNRLQVECNALTRECAQLQDDNRALALVRGSKLNA